MKRRIVCENLRSAYNVGAIFRTADALGRGVVLTGYTARPDHKGVRKTALGAEQATPLQIFDDLEGCYQTLLKSGTLIVSELTEKSISLKDLSSLLSQDTSPQNLYLVVGNEVTGVEESTLLVAHHITHIPMLGMKESLNVAQAAAIAMRELGQL